MNNLNNMCDKLEEYSVAELGKERDKINTKELGEVFDMMKDISETKRNKAEECYYYTLIDAMENADYGTDYDEYGRLGYSGNRGNSRMTSRNARRGYEPYMGYDDGRRMSEMNYGRMGYSNNRSNESMNGASRSMSSNTRYGYSHDDYMEAKQMYSLNDPNGKHKRMEALNDYLEDLTDSAKELVNGMSPEEKQAWKSKINNLINM